MGASAAPDGLSGDRLPAGAGEDRVRPPAESAGAGDVGAERLEEAVAQEVAPRAAGAEAAVPGAAGAEEAVAAGRAWPDQSLGTAPAPVVARDWPAVLDALAEAQARGLIGRGQDLGALAEHARGFAGPIAGAARVLDLGSGGGVPGLVVAALCPDATVTLVDASVSRTDWLRRVVGRLGWEHRVVVVTGRAEELGHDATWRESQDAVVARGFGPPLVTAEVGSALLRLGGRLVVSEPPTPDARRWPAPALSALGLRRRPWPDARYAVLEAVARPRPEIPRAGVVRGRTS